MPNGAACHRDVIDAARKWRGSGIAIATVVETWRSAPCPAGTHMLIHEDGRFVGSVSGGCVEADVLETAAHVIANGQHRLKRYGLSDDAVWEAGLPCGGDILILIQPVCEGGFHPDLFIEIESANRAGRPLIVRTNLDTGLSSLDAGTFANLYHPPRRLLIVGAVEIARTLARVARDAGIEVTVIDPRARFLTKERFPDATLDDRWPDEAIRALRPDHRTAVVTLSHDPKIDDVALQAAVAAPTGYVAALGSRTSHAARLSRLTALGCSEAALSRIEGPAGVTINAINAAEIALSIAAGMIRAFNDGQR